MQQSATSQQRNHLKKPSVDQPSLSSSLSLDDHRAVRNDNSDARSHITETSSINTPSASLPMTPVLFGTSDQGSALSGASSRRNSLTGSFSEDQYSRGQSVVEDTEKETGSTLLDSGSAPQLVMPSIKMPSRRPFTETGKSMGRLKVLIAGDSGVGKTSLIKAIVQTCEHIVHVDPITPPSASSSVKKSRGRKGSRPEASTQKLTEIYASTKPYPTWWSDLDDVSVLKRRKSLGDAVLERNLCFVDTPGYSSRSSPMDVIVPVVKYVETQLQKISSDALNESEIISMVGGDGGCQVDVVFYIINEKIKPADIEYLRLLSPLTNIVPILARADSFSSEEVVMRKQRLLSDIQLANIRPFSFGDVSTYAVSSATGSDLETMDASLLMSPDYVQPLIPTDLALLVRDVFCQDGTSWLRHSAARKYLQWRHDSQEPETRGLPHQLSHPPTETALGLVSTSPSSYSLARIADHTQREERMAQIRLANWAAELQRSLERERAHYETLARNERAVWLTERLGECVQNGTLVPRTSPQKHKTKPTRRLRPSKTAPHQDPLGLLEVVAKFKRRGRIALEFLGSVGVLGGLAFWAHRHHWHGRVYEWVVEEWALFWGLDR